MVYEWIHNSLSVGVSTAALNGVKLTKIFPPKCTLFKWTGLICINYNFLQWQNGYWALSINICPWPFPIIKGVIMLFLIGYNQEYGHHSKTATQGPRHNILPPVVALTLWYSCPVLQSSHLTQWIYRNVIGWETKPGHIILVLLSEHESVQLLPMFSCRASLLGHLSKLC